MQKLLMKKSQEIVEVTDSEAKRLIEMGSATKVVPTTGKQYKDRMMSKQKGKTYVAKPERVNDAGEN